MSGRVLLEGKSVQIADVLTDPEWAYPEIARLGNFRTILGVPLLREGLPIGIFLLHRTAVRPFTEKQVKLVETFADQAVIAIENTRLFEAEQQRSRELAESLEQQTATSKVLDVISRSAFDLQAVFETVAENSVRLCEADRALIFRFDGELLRMAVAYNTLPEFKKFLEQNPIRLGRHSSSARAALERRTIHIPDVWADPEYTYGARDAEAIHTVLSVPILKGDNLLGVLTIYHLEGIRPFTDKQIALVETFADQAAIAIENMPNSSVNCVNHYNSKLLPLTCLRSSADRLSICRQCYKPSLNQLPGSAMPKMPPLRARKMVPSTAPRPTASLASLWIMSKIFR